MSRSNSSVIKLKKVGKTYQLHHQKPTLVEQLFSRRRTEQFSALHSISLSIGRAERVGIIGDNGSGKTTLLKLIAGITAPTTGSVSTIGKIVSLIDLEAGFHPDLSGQENVFLNGLVIGMSKTEIKKNYSSIISFADVGEFIDAPLYTYSAGMKLRLGLSIAIHSNPDILILDEAIMAGDQSFQRKTSQKINEFFRAGKTIVVVTHWMEFLRKHAQRIIWLDKGKIKRDGDLTVINEYVSHGKKS